MTKTVCLLSLLIGLASCIDPFNANVRNGEQSMVVNGMITDQPGPYTIELSRTSELNNPYAKTIWIKGATVTISDDEGNSELLSETTPGHYTTSTTQGIVGRVYSLKIVTSEGTEYESSTEKLLPVGDFSNLRYTFEQKLIPDDPAHPANGFNIYLDADLLPEQEGLVRWRWSGTYEIVTHPELRTKVAPGPIPTFIPDPYPCSGYTLPRHSTTMEYVAPCSCCSCWVTQYNQAPLLSNVHLVNNNRIPEFYLAYVPASKRFFYDKYYLQVEQMSTSQSVYDFWKKVAQQGNQGSDLFQTPPPATVGNIHRVSENGLNAIGVFAAASIKSHAFIIYSSAIPYDLPSSDTVALDCREVYPNSSTTKPDFW